MWPNPQETSFFVQYEEKELSSSVPLIKEYQFCCQLLRGVIQNSQLTFSCSNSTTKTLEK